jgi:transitional endoplasmic reticulum ATPase
MSFHADRKHEHEAAAATALGAKDYALAFFHVGKAAEFGFILAEQNSGPIADRYVEEACENLGWAEELKAKAATQPKPKKPVKDASKDPAKDQDAEADEEWLVTEKPNVKLSDIAGMEDVKAKLAEMILEPLKHPEKAKEWGIKAGGGILLFGPPGNGKTTLGKAVASELGAAFYYASGAQIRSKWHGESEQRLRKLIQAARSQPLSVLFLDDVDGLLPKRGGDSVVDNRIVVQFLSEIGGFEESKNVFLLLGATNKPWSIDEAVFRTGRFDEKIFVGLPDKPACEFMVKKHLDAAPVDPTVNAATVAEKLAGYTGSDIVAIVQSAKRAGFRRSIGGGANLLTLADIEQAMKTIPSSATPALMRQYEEFAKARFK